MSNFITEFNLFCLWEMENRAAFITIQFQSYFYVIQIMSLVKGDAIMFIVGFNILSLVICR